MRCIDIFLTYFAGLEGATSTPINPKGMNSNLENLKTSSQQMKQQVTFPSGLQDDVFSA